MQATAKTPPQGYRGPLERLGVHPDIPFGVALLLVCTLEGLAGCLL
jgi:hypothetical protein